VLNWPYLAALAATFAFAGMCLGFLINTPTLLGPDEVYHFDRVIAAEHGQIVLAPEAINTSMGARGIEHTYVFSYMRRGGKSQAPAAVLRPDGRPDPAVARCRRDGR
jgi:hypothetical protein